MALEAVAAVAVKEIAVEAAKEAAVQAAREIAQKMATELAGQGRNELQAAMMERQTIQDGFRIGEMPETKGEAREILKQKESDAYEELREKLDSKETSQIEGDVPPEKVELQELKQVVSDYADDLLSRSEVPETIDSEAVVNADYKKVSPECCQAGRVEFNKSKADLISKWEEKNGMEWPRYKEDVYLNETKIRRAGDMYDCHHVQPLTYGGKNEVANVTPLHALEHFDRQGLHAANSPYSKMENLLKQQEVA